MADTPLDRLATITSSRIYAVPKRADLQWLMDDHAKLTDELSTARRCALDADAEANRLQLRLDHQPRWSELFAALALLPITFAIAALHH